MVAHFFLSSKKIIFLINTIWVFQRVFFPHRVCRHVVNVQYAAQIRMTGKDNPEKVVSLSFHPVSSVPQISGRWNVCISISQKNFYAYTQVIYKAVQVIDHTDRLFLFRIMNSCQVREVNKLQCRIVLQKLQDIDDLLSTCFKGW